MARAKNRGYQQSFSPSYTIRRWRLGIYIRLSKEDLKKGKDDSNSVKNQRDLLNDFYRRNIDEFESITEYDFSPWPPAAFFKYPSGLPFKLKGLSCFLMIRSGTFFDGSKGFVLFSEEYKKSEPFSYQKKVRILLIWCTSRDSNPGPTDQEKPTWNNRQFSKSRSFVVFIVLSWICVLYLLHPLQLSSSLASVIQLFRCAKSVQKCAESKSAP